jgi:SAM-dependent methyltransferase
VKAAKVVPKMMGRWPAPLEERVRTFLVCPQCRRPLDVGEERLWCQGCGFEGAIRDDVVIMGKAVATSYFDDKFLLMHEGHSGEGGDWEFAYGQQVAFLERYLRTGTVLLDVGCGPSICYKKPAGSFLVGLEYSFPSIRSNRDVDLRICGSATAVPFGEGAVDLVVCFYSLHHMVGETVRESVAIVEKVFEELGRVVKPGGHLVVFEMRPWWPFRLVQGLCWDVARRVLGGKLDMHMWPQEALEPPGKARIPGARFEVRVFETSIRMLSPIFALPWLKIPRMVYPLSPVAYVWAKP